MPTYNFLDNATGREWTDLMSISDMEKMLADNPTYQQVPGGFFYGDTILQGKKKPPEGFRDLLKSIKKKNKSAIVPTTVNTW
jgi:hypothetical protein